jgi:hypothetical protein
MKILDDCCVINLRKDTPEPKPRDIKIPYGTYIHLDVEPENPNYSYEFYMGKRYNTFQINGWFKFEDVWYFYLRCTKCKINSCRQSKKDMEYPFSKVLTCRCQTPCVLPWFCKKVWLKILAIHKD